MKKKETALEKYDVVKFICNSTDAKHVVKIVGPNYLLQRGSAVTEFIESLTGEVQIQENNMNIDECEAIAAL